MKIETAMNEYQIQDAVNAILDEMLARGLVKPKCTAMIEAASGTVCIYMHWEEYGMTYGRTELGKGENMSEAIAIANDIINSIPAKADRDKAEFMRLLANAIDKGKDIGIDVDFLNPLKETMKRLSENALTNAAGAK